jgi:hypothetical protein
MYKLSRTKVSALTLALALVTSLGFVTVATALASNASVAANTGTSSSDSAKVQIIITKGNAEISRRLTTLGSLSSKINAASELTASDKTSLSTEVSTEVSALTALKTKLDADTDLATAKTDANSIFTEYRVYALVVPQVELVKTADNQQVTESKLSDLAIKLHSRITGSNSTLSDMTAKINAAQAISSSIETKVVTLQPTDYDTDHRVLSGDATQLKTAQTDNQAAASDAKILIDSLKS